MAQLAIDNASKVFLDLRGQMIWAVKEVSLEVADGGLLVLVGPSGCGKTTLLRMIAGLEDVPRGTISFDGCAVNHRSPKDRNVAMVFQNLALYPHLTAFENLALGLRLRKVPASDLARRVREVAGWLGLEGCLGRRPGQLSGGERQRVALGRALVRKPGILLLDEPFSNLDAPLRAQLRAEISSWQTRLRVTMIYVTHDQTDALALGQRIAVMKGGSIQQVADPTTLYLRPANLFVAGFIGPTPMNLLRGMITTQHGQLLFAPSLPGRESAPPHCLLELPAERQQGLASFLGRNVVLGLRPEHVRLGAGSAGSVTAAMTATVERAEVAGPGTFVRLKAGAQDLTARAPETVKFEPDEIVTVGFDTRWARFFDPDSGQALVEGPGP